MDPEPDGTQPERRGEGDVGFVAAARLELDELLEQLRGRRRADHPSSVKAPIAAHDGL